MKKETKKELGIKKMNAKQAVSHLIKTYSATEDSPLYRKFKRDVYQQIGKIIVNNHNDFKGLMK